MLYVMQYAAAPLCPSIKSSSLSFRFIPSHIHGSHYAPMRAQRGAFSARLSSLPDLARMHGTAFTHPSRECSHPNGCSTHPLTCLSAPPLLHACITGMVIPLSMSLTRFHHLPPFSDLLPLHSMPDSAHTPPGLFTSLHKSDCSSILHQLYYTHKSPSLLSSAQLPPSQAS